MSKGCQRLIQTDPRGFMDAQFCYFVTNVYTVDCVRVTCSLFMCQCCVETAEYNLIEQNIIIAFTHQM